jgi:hypothetical protein
MYSTKDTTALSHGKNESDFTACVLASLSFVNKGRMLLAASPQRSRCEFLGLLRPCLTTLAMHDDYLQPRACQTIPPVSGTSLGHNVKLV